jgi:hypothetical protein
LADHLKKVKDLPTWALTKTTGVQLNSTTAEIVREWARLVWKETGASPEDITQWTGLVQNSTVSRWLRGHEK